MTDSTARAPDPAPADQRGAQAPTNSAATRSTAQGATAAPDAAGVTAERPAVDPAPALAQEAAALKDRLLRALAEMENLRRRTEREVADARTYGVTNFARDIVGVADGMERAMKALDD